MNDDRESWRRCYDPPAMLEPIRELPIPGSIPCCRAVRYAQSDDEEVDDDLYPNTA